MRQKIVAGNWKMNLSYDEALQLANDINQIESNSEVQIVVFPTSIYAHSCQSIAKNYHVGLQNAYPKDSGAFTGEVSMKQLKDANFSHVLIGHSERREYFNESNSFLKEKVDAAINHDIKAFFCCGEPLGIRENGTYFDYLKTQLIESLFHLSASDFVKTVIAYEPIWAIGTGKTASIEQAEEMHKAIRSWIEEKYSQQIAENYSILYGGSCNPSNAKALFACPNVDGGLIGGAALKIDDFSVLVAKDTWTI
jgi:triosephosphate isomerase